MESAKPTSSHSTSTPPSDRHILLRRRRQPIPIAGSDGGFHTGYDRASSLSTRKRVIFSVTGTAVSKLFALCQLGYRADTPEYFRRSTRGLHSHIIPLPRLPRRSFPVYPRSPFSSCSARNDIPRTHEELPQRTHALHRATPLIRSPPRSNRDDQHCPGHPARNLS